MVAGIITTVIGALVGYVTLNSWSKRVFMEGYRQGMTDEANEWFSAVSSIKPPNWQSLPDPDGTTGDVSVEKRKQYVEVYQRALISIQAETVIKRVESLKEQIFKAMKEQSGNNAGPE